MSSVLKSTAAEFQPSSHQSSASVQPSAAATAAAAASAAAATAAAAALAATVAAAAKSASPSKATETVVAEDNKTTTNTTKTTPASVNEQLPTDMPVTTTAQPIAVADLALGNESHHAAAADKVVVVAPDSSTAAALSNVDDDLLNKLNTLNLRSSADETDRVAASDVSNNNNTSTQSDAKKKSAAAVPEITAATTLGNDNEPQGKVLTPPAKSNSSVVNNNVDATTTTTTANHVLDNITDAKELLTKSENVANNNTTTSDATAAPAVTPAATETPAAPEKDPVVEDDFYSMRMLPSSKQQAATIAAVQAAAAATKANAAAAAAAAAAAKEANSDATRSISGGSSSSGADLSAAASSVAGGTTTIVLKYVAGQWSPDNETGRKFWTVEQLQQLRKSPASQLAFDTTGMLSAIVLNKQNAKYNTQQSTGSTGSGSNSFKQPAPMSNRSSTGPNSGSSGNAMYSKRSSNLGGNNNQTGGGASSSIGGGKSGSRSGMIHVSLRAEVKLNEVANAWKPNMLRKDVDENSEEVIYRRVRGILNKLTPEKFDDLLNQMMGFKIDSDVKLQGVCNLVFEKAIDEPNFSVAYAQLCHELSSKLKRDQDGTPTTAAAALTTPAAVAGAPQKTAFSLSMIQKCQSEFTQHVSTSIDVRLAPFQKRVDEATDPEEKADLLMQLDDEESKLRRRSNGTVRFIGELFKFNMLNPGVMMRCIQTLIAQRTDDKLECACKLLQTVGQKLETTKQETKSAMNGFFDTLQSIVNGKDSKVCSRVRFMIQDVVELKRNKWVPRKNDITVNPKTMDQIQKECEAEVNNIQLLNFNLGNSGGGGGNDRGRSYGDRGSSRGGSGSGDVRMSGGNSGFNKGSSHRSGPGGSQGGGGGHNNNNNEDPTWHSVPNKSRMQIDTAKLRNVPATDISNTTFGTANQFKWNSTASATVTPGSTFSTMTTNSFAMLDGSRGSIGRDNKGPYHSKGSMERERYGKFLVSSAFFMTFILAQTGFQFGHLFIYYSIQRSNNLIEFSLNPIFVINTIII